PSDSPTRSLAALVRSTRSPLLDSCARLALGLAALDGLPLVVRLFAFRQADGHLDAAVLEIHPDRHERHAPLDGLANQLPDLLAVQEQLAAALRIVIAVAAVAVRVDVHVVDPDL